MLFQGVSRHMKAKHVLPFVSVIVITKNNAATMERCIKSLLQQTYPKGNYDVVFVDGHSTDGTDETIMKYAKTNQIMKLHYEDHGTMGFARNLGIGNSKGEIVAFTDGDATVPEDWIEGIASRFSKGELVALGGLDKLVSLGESDRIIDSWRRLGKAFGVKAIPCIKTVNFAMRRDALNICGGFDPKLSHYDETELLARIYSKAKTDNIVYDPEIVVYHIRQGPSKLSKGIKRNFRKSSDSTSVLMRRYMIRVAVANPTSTLGTNFLMIPACIVGIPLFLSLIAEGWLMYVILFSMLTYAAMLGIYMAGMFLRTRKASPMIPLVLTIDVAARFGGTLFGLVRSLCGFIRARLHRAVSR